MKVKMVTRKKNPTRRHSSIRYRGIFGILKESNVIANYR